MSPGRPNAPPCRTPSPTPDPFATPYPEYAVTFPLHPFPSLSYPTPRTSPSSSRLRHLFPPIRPDPTISTALLKHTHIRGTLAYARDRPRSPENLHPNGIRPQAPVGAVGNRPLATGHWPPLSRGATSVSQTARSGITELRRTAGKPSYESHRMSQNRAEFASCLHGNRSVQGPQ